MKKSRRTKLDICLIMESFASYPRRLVTSGPQLDAVEVNLSEGIITADVDEREIKVYSVYLFD